MNLSVENPLRIYTELATRPSDEILVLEEFGSLGPKTTIKELSDAWIAMHRMEEWTIVIVDPLDFVDSLTTKSMTQVKRHHHGNFKSWEVEKNEVFFVSLSGTRNTMLVIEGERLPENLPVFWRAMDRTVVVKQPSVATLGPDVS